MTYNNISYLGRRSLFVQQVSSLEFRQPELMLGIAAGCIRPSTCQEGVPAWTTESILQQCLFSFCFESPSSYCRGMNSLRASNYFVKLVCLDICPVEDGAGSCKLIEVGSVDFRRAAQRMDQCDLILQGALMCHFLSSFNDDSSREALLLTLPIILAS